MYPIDHPYVNESMRALAPLQEPGAIADTCIKLLKSNTINQLSTHEWVGWLDKVKDYLETALKVSIKGEDIRALIQCEMEFRKKDYTLPIIVSYGSLADGKVQEPIIRLVSQQRMEWGLFLKRQPPDMWNENWDVPTVLREKKDLTVQQSVGNPTNYAARALNILAPVVKSIPQTKQDATALVHYLHKLFPWKDNINCEYRALAAKKFIEALGVDPEALSFVIIGNKSYFGASSTLSFKDYKWKYHEVLGVKTANDGFFVLDPTVHETEALKVEQWQAMINGLNHNVFMLSQSDCRDDTAYAVATHNRFPGLEKISDETHPSLVALAKDYVGS